MTLGCEDGMDMDAFGAARWRELMLGTGMLRQVVDAVVHPRLVDPHKIVHKKPLYKRPLRLHQGSVTKAYNTSRIYYFRVLDFKLSQAYF